MVRSTQGVSEAELITCETMRPPKRKLKEQEKSGRKKGNFVKIYNTYKPIIN